MSNRDDPSNETYFHEPLLLQVKHSKYPLLVRGRGFKPLNQWWLRLNVNKYFLGRTLGNLSFELIEVLELEDKKQKSYI